MTDIQEKIRKAEQAKAKAADRLARLRTAAAAADRRADAHRKITLGGLVIAAECQDWDPAAIVGALADLRQNVAAPAELERWRKSGISIMEARKVARQRGLSLLSVMVAIALGAGVLAVGWTVATNARRTQSVQAAAQQAVGLSHRVTGAWAASSDFATLSTTSAAARGVFQRGDLDASGQPVDPWGGAVTLSPQGQGFSIIFAGVPAKACPGLVAASASDFTAVSVQVATDWQQVASHGKADMSAAGLACGSAGDPLLVRFDGGRAGASFPITPLTPCSVPPPQTQNVACPPGQVSSVAPYGPNGISQKRDAACMGPYGPAIWGPWTPVGSTCAPVCVTPPPAVSTATQWAPESAPCPPGWSGSHTWQAEQTQSTTVAYVCPAPTGAATATPPTVTPWAPTGATSGDVNTCTAPPPPPPPPPCGPAPSPLPPTACPPGQTGSITTPWVSAPAPTCWTPGTPVNTCAAPPPPPVCGPAPAPASTPCPPGWTGSDITPYVSASAPTCWVAGTPVNTCAAPPPPPSPAAWQCRDATAPAAISAGWTGHGGPGNACGTNTASCISLNSPAGNSYTGHYFNPNKGVDRWICACQGDPNVSSGVSSAIFMGRYPGNGAPAGETSAYWRCP